MGEVAGHELVYGELLIGDRGGRKKLLSAYEMIQQAQFVPHREVVEFVRHRDLQGHGAGWIDIHLLAAAIVERMRLWTADPRLADLASELGIAYQVLGKLARRPKPLINGCVCFTGTDPRAQASPRRRERRRPRRKVG